MKRITHLVPRKTDVLLGDRIFQVGEMRLSDLAHLQGWLEEQWDNPLEATRMSLVGLTGKERRDMVSAIWDACMEGPPVWGTSRAQKLFNTGEGITHTFITILRQFHPDLTRDEVINIASATGDHPDGWLQYQSMLKSWQPVEAIEEVAFMLGMDETGPEGKPITWVQAVCQTCEDYGWSIEYVMGLTMRQFKAIRTGGKPREFGIPVAPKTNLKAVVAAMKKKLAEEAQKGESNGR